MTLKRNELCLNLGAGLKLTVLNLALICVLFHPKFALAHTKIPVPPSDPVKGVFNDHLTCPPITTVAEGRVTTSPDPDCTSCADYSAAMQWCATSTTVGNPGTVQINQKTVPCKGIRLPSHCPADPEKQKCEKAEEKYHEADACDAKCIANGDKCSNLPKTSSSGKVTTTATAQQTKACPSTAKNAADDNEKQMKYFEDRMKDDKTQLSTAQEKLSQDQESSQNSISSMSDQVKQATTASQQLQIQLQTKLQTIKEASDSATSQAQKNITDLNNSVLDIRTTQAAQANNAASQAAQAVLDKCWTDADKSTTDYFNEIARGNTAFSGNPTAFSVSQQLSLAANGNRTSQKTAIRDIYYAQCLNTQVAKSAMATVQNNLQTTLTALNSKSAQIRKNVADAQANLAKVIQNANNQGNIAQAQAASESYKLTQQVQSANAQIEQKTAQAKEQIARDQAKVADFASQEQQDEASYNNYKALYDKSAKNPITSDDADQAKEDTKNYNKLLAALRAVKDNCCDGSNEKNGYKVSPQGICGTRTQDAVKTLGTQ